MGSGQLSLHFFLHFTGSDVVHLFHDIALNLIWTTNDPDKNIRNGMDGGMVWIGNWRRCKPMFLLTPS